MRKFVISLKSKKSGQDAVAPYIVNSLSGLGDYSARLSSMDLIVIVDSINEEDQFVEPLELKLTQHGDKA